MVAAESLGQRSNTAYRRVSRIPQRSVTRSAQRSAPTRASASLTKSLSQIDKGRSSTRRLGRVGGTADLPLAASAAQSVRPPEHRPASTHDESVHGGTAQPGSTTRRCTSASAQLSRGCSANKHRAPNSVRRRRLSAGRGLSSDPRAGAGIDTAPQDGRRRRRVTAFDKGWSDGATLPMRSHVLGQGRSPRASTWDQCVA